MTPRHRTPPSTPTELRDVPCRDCGHTVRVRLYPDSRGVNVPVFCNACLTARVEAIRAAPPVRRPGSGRKKKEAA